MRPASRHSFRILPLALALALAAGCSCGGGGGDTPDSGTPQPTTDGGIPTDGGTPTDGGSKDDGGSPQGEVPTDINAPDNGARDSDCDGLSDEEEFSTVWAGGLKTRPGLADSDEDGILDGVEAGRTSSPSASCTRFSGDAHPASRTNPTQRDSDGDGCADGQEDANHNGAMDPGETNPSLPGDCAGQSAPDADGDGVPDAKEDTNGNGQYEPQAGETNWQSADSDGDGLNDGLEDANKNGRVDLGETDPRRRDSDCDGLADGPNQGSVLGEDLNANGAQDPGETDPTRADSDDDGLSDGLEKGVTRANAADAASCPAFVGDAQPTTTTDPLNADSDGDGIVDGAEDANQNGSKDPDELDPNNGSDGSGPQAKVCRADALRPVVFKTDNGSDVQLALPDSFTEVVSIPGGRGLMGYDGTNKVAFLVWRQPAPSGADTPTKVETALRAKLSSGGTAVTTLPTQTFDTWDGFKALSAAYEQTGSADLKTRANALANALVGAGSGVLTGSAGEGGTLHLQAEWVYRSAQSVVGLIALAPKARMSGPSLFRVTDTAGGSALAQFGDTTGVQCEPFTAGTSKVDFLFVVDASASMEASQTNLGKTAQAMATALGNTPLDWRAALVTSAYHISGRENSNKLRGFTTDINVFKSWLTASPSCTDAGSQCGNGGACRAVNGGWTGVCDGGQEGVLGAARKAVNDLVDRSLTTEQTNRVRNDAQLVVVLLGDADDQTSGDTSTVEKCGNGGTNTVSGSECVAATTYSTFFVSGNETGENIPVHGILCPPGERCNNEFNPVPQRHGAVVEATGGVRGSIKSETEIAQTMQAIVDAVIARAGHKLLQKAPIGASIKVALSTVKGASCTSKDDLPRSRTHGFDFDGKQRTVSFFGDCQPGAATAQAAVSYRYWRDETRAPDGAACDVDCGGSCGTFEACNTQTCACECAGTASCGPGQRFDNSASTCGCVCDVQALGCGAGYQANAEACACVCQDDCGGCPAQTVCNPSRCACVPVIE